MRSQIPAASLPRIAAGRLLRERAYDALRDAIVRLELPPGLALTERMLSERLGVSKSPIRDALIHLEREGLVRSTPFKGFEVAPLTEADCREVFQFREALEVYCVDRFARGHDTAALAAVEETHREQAGLIEAGRPLEALQRSMGRTNHRRSVMIDNRHRGSRFCALTSVLLAWFLGLHSAVAEDADGLRVTDYFISHTSTEPFYAEQKLDPSVTLHVREVVLAGRERTQLALDLVKRVLGHLQQHQAARPL